MTVKMNQVFVHQVAVFFVVSVTRQMMHCVSIDPRFLVVPPTHSRLVYHELKDKFSHVQIGVIWNETTFVLCLSGLLCQSIL